jgi:hypothetical protein
MQHWKSSIRLAPVSSVPVPQSSTELHSHPLRSKGWLPGKGWQMRWALPDAFSVGDHYHKVIRALRRVRVCKESEVCSDTARQSAGMLRTTTGSAGECGSKKRLHDRHDAASSAMNLPRSSRSDRITCSDCCRIALILGEEAASGDWSPQLCRIRHILVLLRRFDRSILHELKQTTHSLSKDVTSLYGGIRAIVR